MGCFGVPAVGEGLASSQTRWACEKRPLEGINSSCFSPRGPADFCGPGRRSLGQPRGDTHSPVPPREKGKDSPPPPPPQGFPPETRVY